MLSRQLPDSPEGSSWLSPFRKVFTLQLSLTSLLGVCLVALIGAGWIFAFGVIIGRGFEPEKKLPVLGRLMAPAAEAAPEQSDGIIKPEELNFISELRTQPTVGTNQPAPTPRPQETRPADPKKQDKPAQVAPATEAATLASNPEARPQRYDFVLQVIAYKKSGQADTFREKLENAGLRTKLQVEKDKQGNPRVFHIQVLFKGTDAEADQVREILARHGVKAPMVASRKAI